MSAVCAGNPVLVAQMYHHARCHRLLADVQVKGAGDFAVFHHLACGFLKKADADHASMQVDQGFVGNLFAQVSSPKLVV